jgi:hypothetical protein
LKSGVSMPPMPNAPLDTPFSNILFSHSTQHSPASATLF